ncbi:MAG TPA: SRPBCC family protein [Cyclobacteriaceae bacterium]|nr:SRPBCC family protein [Cyclobacteriaceae bacterium]
MSIHTYKTVQWLPVNIHKAWDFFSSAKNLSKITPSDMNFIIRTDLADDEIYEGMLIDYIVSPLFGIPVSWKTEITEVNAPHFFKDSQLKGPFSLWEHTHSFEEQGNGTLMEDIVRYRLPFGLMGTLAHRLVVKKRLEGIFDYRRKVLEKLL